MFTGIVTHLGKVTAARSRGGLLALEIAAPEIAKELHKGDSVAVNGVCLTAVDTSRRRFSAEVMGETLARSTLERLRKGASVNLELPARLSDRLGGHLVQGHVDGVARVARVEEDEGSRRLWLEATDEVLRYLVAKGSVALDGVSLTVVEVGRTTFQVAIIPHTLKETTIGAMKVGSTVNVEVDVLAKYVERLLDRGAAPAGPREGRR
ncbi:MAG TPA: riboflavin synthase [Actinomycetota bacterium]|nr:riboflavin synthase [Actinomycetota bacterium]